jgi:L-amino acid N-acyltransferase YncA
MAAELSASHEVYDPIRWVAPNSIRDIYATWFERSDAGDNLAVFVAEGAVASLPLAGYLVAEVWSAQPVFWTPACVYIHDIFVRPVARTGGAGEALFRAVVAWGHARGQRQFRGLVSSENPAARGFFERRGFRVTATEITLDT